MIHTMFDLEKRQAEEKYPYSKKRDKRRNKHKIKASLFIRSKRLAYIKLLQERFKKLLSTPTPPLFAKLAAIKKLQPNSGTTIRMRRYEPTTP